MATVYLETSIISYLRQKPSQDVITAARQLLTQRWWDDQRDEYEIVTSQYVLDEASRGDPTLAAERMSALSGIPLLDLPDDIPQLAAEILRRTILPTHAGVDALHIAAAAFHGLDYLLTWNCKHIANAHILPRIRDCLTDLHFSVPVICTPEEMLGDEDQTYDNP
jgi:hypothetical protein